MNAEYRVKMAQGRANQEQQVKEEAINKILEMRNRQTLLNTEDETLTADFWQGKWQEMQVSMADLREENLILHKVVHEAAQNQITLQNQVHSLSMGGGVSSQPGSAQHDSQKMNASAATLRKSLNQQSDERTTLDTALRENSIPLDKNPYQPTTEQIEDQWNSKNKQTIRKNSQIPKIMTTKTNIDSLRLLEPQKRSTKLPLIKAKESAREKSQMKGPGSGDVFHKRHRSVDPRTTLSNANV